MSRLIQIWTIRIPNYKHTKSHACLRNANLPAKLNIGEPENHLVLQRFRIKREVPVAGKTDSN